MKETLFEIVCAFKTAEASSPDSVWLDKLVRRRNREQHDASRRIAKRRLLPAYLRMKETEPATLQEWGVTPEIDAALIRLLKAKPRRTASGVATITVLTKPWACASDCLYCPNDVRMPKSYMADEPACQRAERNYFDPYLQVISRLRVLNDMGHVTDKIELIVLGGTFNDYPKEYQTWFMTELFRALNDAGEDAQTSLLAEKFNKRAAQYESAGVLCEAEDLRVQVAAVQEKVNLGKVCYNQAAAELYGAGSAWEQVAGFQSANFEDLETQQRINEGAAHRVVGLVVETRPDAITPQSLVHLRALGCTKIQMGIQSLNQHILDVNERGATVDQIVQAFALLRLFGFKSHIHLMVNLLGATPTSDRAEYHQLVSDPRFIPDEVKLYPCALVENAHLMRAYDAGDWQPYDEATLVELLAADILVTPPYTRISRMIRDISATDIVVGNKKTNLRQIVEGHVGALQVQEMRMREIATGEIDASNLRLECISYRTTVSEEKFLQWVTPQNKLAGFLRLSLPDAQQMDAYQVLNQVLNAGQAMIREVHVYGKVAALHDSGESAQHAGLGRKLVEEACNIARSVGYSAINVISSVGTREYYRKLGFVDSGLYQTRSLSN